MLDAVIFVTDPPDFEIRDGLVHVTQMVGSHRVERVMRLNTFLRAIQMAKEAVRQYEECGTARVIPLPTAKAGNGTH